MIHFIDKLLALFSTRDAAASRTAGAGEGPHTSTPEPQRPHYQEIADMLGQLDRERELRHTADLARRIQFDLET